MNPTALVPGCQTWPVVPNWNALCRFVQFAFGPTSGCTVQTVDVQFGSTATGRMGSHVSTWEPLVNTCYRAYPGCTTASASAITRNAADAMLRTGEGRSEVVMESPELAGEHPVARHATEKSGRTRSIAVIAIAFTGV